MDLDNPAVSSGSGILFLLLICLLVWFCCRRRQQQHLRLHLENEQQPRGQGRRHRRKWRRRRDNHDQSRVVIVEHEAPCPESAAPVARQTPQSPVHNPQYIINLNPPSQMPGHYPPQAPFQAQQHPWQHQQQVVQNVQFPPPPHASGVFPHDAANRPVGGLFVPQQQPGGFAQLYAQAQPDMNVFPQPPPPYETEPFPPPKQK